MTDTPEDTMLDLSDLAPERKPVKLPDGTVVDMVNPSELSFYDRAQVLAKTQKVMNLTETVNKKPTKARAVELEGALRDLAAVVLPDAPKEVIASLSPVSLDLVSGAFLGLYGDMMKVMSERIGVQNLAASTSGS